MTFRLPCRSQLVLMCVAIASLAMVAGCSTSEHAEAAGMAVDEHLDETPKHATHELSLGSYMISVPVKLPDGDAWYRISFDLAVSVRETDEADMLAFVQDHEKRLRREVGSVFRRAEIDELKNPQLSEIRTHLVDAINREIGRAFAMDVYLANYNAEIQ